MEYPSKKIEAAVNELASLPGIGRKTALRLALHILKQSEGAAEKLGESIIEMRKGVTFCKSVATSRMMISVKYVAILDETPSWSAW